MLNIERPIAHQSSITFFLYTLYIETDLIQVQFRLYALGLVLVMRVQRGIKIVSPPGIWSPGYFST